jgi:UDP-N-acetylmuramoyl-tripeptide--D-alanyl-D-alanine ligase
MSILWTSEQIANATNSCSTGNWQASRVVIDSRDIKSGDLFIALKGEIHDAHKFVSQALSTGAVAAIVQDIPPNMSKDDERLLVVDDTTDALQNLVITARRRLTGKLIGITGSVGKTSLKEALSLVLSNFGSTYATKGNFNNHIGMPLTLANMPEDTDFAIIEMGMNHSGEIAHLTKISRPNIAIITNVEAAHIEFFANVEEIADAKTEIIEGLEPNGVLLLPSDNQHYQYMKDKAIDFGINNIVSFGTNRPTDYQLIDPKITNDGLTGYIIHNEQKTSFNISIFAHYAGLEEENQKFMSTC